MKCNAKPTYNPRFEPTGFCRFWHHKSQSPAAPAAADRPSPQVPALWGRVGYLSVKSLGSWVNDLILRVDAFAVSPGRERRVV